jgi:uncharacterized membrane protein
MILALDDFYVLVGLLFAATAIMNLRDRSNPRRFTTALFWGLYALLYLAGERLPPAVAGLLMIAMALVAGAAWSRAARRRCRRKRRGAPARRGSAQAAGAGAGDSRW